MPVKVGAPAESNSTTREEPRAGSEQARTEALVEAARRLHCAEIADCGGMDVSGEYARQFAQVLRAVDMMDGRVWIQAPATGGWTDILEYAGGYRPGAEPKVVRRSGGALLLPTQDEIDRHRETADGPSTTRPNAHSLGFNAANIRSSANHALGEPLSREQRIADIRAEADRRFGPGWREIPGPDHPEFRERTLPFPWSVRVPEYRFTLMGGILGTVRIASVFVPLLGSAFRRWEDREMYRREMLYGRNNTGGAYDPEKGPNADLLAEWRGRREQVRNAIARVDGEGFDDGPRLRYETEHKAMAGAYVEALSHMGAVSGAMAELLANEVHHRPDPDVRYDWLADDPLVDEPRRVRELAEQQRAAAQSTVDQPA